MDQETAADPPDSGVIKEDSVVSPHEEQALSSDNQLHVLDIIQQMLDAMEDRISRRIVESEDRLGRQIVESEDRMTRYIIESQDRIFQRIDFVERLSHARALNSSARQRSDLLYPVPLPDGDLPANFPDTMGDFRAMSGPSLSGWIMQYQLVPHTDQVPHAIALKRQLLANHLGIIL